MMKILFSTLAILSFQLQTLAWQDRYAPNFERQPCQMVELNDVIISLLIPESHFSPISARSLYTCDLNKDGIGDFIICISTGGCGLAIEAKSVMFLISTNNNSYIKSKFYCFNFEPSDIIGYNNKSYFILTSYLDSYWNYRIFKILNDGSMIEADADIGSPFPFYIRDMDDNVYKQNNISNNELQLAWVTHKQSLVEYKMMSLNEPFIMPVFNCLPLISAMIAQIII